MHYINGIVRLVSLLSPPGQNSPGVCVFTGVGYDG